MQGKGAPKSLIFRGAVILGMLVPMLFLASCSKEQPALVKAYKVKDYAAMELLLRNGADPNTRLRWIPVGHASYDTRHTVLTLAAANGDKTAIEILLRYGADRHLTSRDGQTAFNWAVQYKHPDAAKMLWEYAPHSGYLPEATRALIQAISNKDNEFYDYLRPQLKGERYPRNLYFFFSRSATSAWSSGEKYGQKPIAFLLARAEKAGTEALCMAVANGRADLVTMLIKAGANPDQRCDYSIVDLDMPGMTGIQPEHFKRHGDKVPFMYVQQALHLDAAQALLDAGADINALNKEGKNALMQFMESGYVSAKTVNAYKEIPDYYQSVPTKTFKINKLPVLDFYLKNGARTDLRDNKGNSLLDLINPDDYDGDFKRKYLSGKVMVNRNQ